VNYVTCVVNAGLMKGAPVAGKRKNYGLRKAQSHRSDRKQVLSSSRAKHVSVPCIGLSRADKSASEQASVVWRKDSHKSAARDGGGRFHSAVVDETEEWAQVMIHRCL